MDFNEIPRNNIRPARNIYQRRAYAAQRALTAIDNISSLANGGTQADRKVARRWMALWMNFATANDN